jgi:hypothetical protein
VFVPVFVVTDDGTPFAISPARKGLRLAQRVSAEGKRTPMKLGFRQGLVSAAIFGAVLFTLVSIDERVRDRFGDLVSRGNSLSPWGDRAGDLGGALVSAVRYQSLENAPLLVFAAAGAVLVAFMLKT